MCTQGRRARSWQRSPTQEGRQALDFARHREEEQNSKQRVCKVQCKREAVWPEGNCTRGAEITLSELLRSANLCPTFQKFSTNSPTGLRA